MCTSVWRKQEAPTLGVASVLARNTEVRHVQKKASVSHESIWCGYKSRMWGGTLSITVASAATDTWQQHEALGKYSPNSVNTFMGISRVNAQLTIAAQISSKVIAKLQISVSTRGQTYRKIGRRVNSGYVSCYSWVRNLLQSDLFSKPVNIRL